MTEKCTHNTTIIAEIKGPGAMGRDAVRNYTSISDKGFGSTRNFQIPFAFADSLPQQIYESIYSGENQTSHYACENLKKCV